MSLSENEGRRFHTLAIALFVWLLTICLLGIWWGRLALTQALRITELEKSLGISSDFTLSHWHRTQRMLYWESGTFVGLLLASSILLCWLYWRDARRTKGLQAFFAAVTHELRTPLSSIRLQAESIDDTLSVQNPNQNSIPKIDNHLVKRLLEDTIRLEAQVERTLELARVEGGGPVYTQALLVKPWLDRFLASWTADYQSRVQLNSTVEDVLIQADPTAIQIILKNLLENSVKHSKKDPVQIDLSVTHEETGGVIFSVKDNGEGYVGDHKALGKIFQKGTYSPGTGVGLYLVQTLMKKMGGWVKFKFSTGLSDSGQSSEKANQLLPEKRSFRSPDKISSASKGFEVSLWLPEGQSHG